MNYLNPGDGVNSRTIRSFHLCGLAGIVLGYTLNLGIIPGFFGILTWLLLGWFAFWYAPSDQEIVHQRMGGEPADE